MGWKIWKASLLFCVALLLLTIPIAAAGDRGRITVTAVRESDLMPVEGATVQARSVSGDRLLSEASTDSEGFARLSDLPVGEIRLLVSHPEAGQDRAILSITSGGELRFEAFLTESRSEETVRVREDRLLVNAADPTAGASTRRSRDFLERQLADGSSLQGVLATVPGAQSNSLGQVHVRGEHKALSLALDGVDLPITTESSILAPLDPEFLETMDVSTGMYDAAQGGQLGAVVDARTRGEGEEPFASFEGRVGDYGQSELILKAGGSNEENSLSYFIGARRSTSDLYLQSPSPTSQELDNSGTAYSFLVRLNAQDDKNRAGLTLSHQNAEFGVPQTPQNFAAGVSQDQSESNTLALLSWNRKLSENDDLLMGLAYQRNRQRLNNNGVFTPYSRVPLALEPELYEEGFPLDPENPGSPYLPATDLLLTQLKPSIDYTRRFDENHHLKLGATVSFINSVQKVVVTDPGGGGLLPNPTGLPGTPTRFSAHIDRDALSTGLYASHTLPLTEALVLNYGLRADTFNDGMGLSTAQLSPRVNLSYAPTDQQALRLSYNRLFQPPPLELDASGLTEVLPQRTHAYELSYENQFASHAVGKVALVYKDFQDQIDVGLLIPQSGIPLFAPINFARAYYKGLELSLATTYPEGWNGFLSATIGEAKPTEPGRFAGHFPEYNDHDQRVQATAGVSYRWKNGLSAGADILYASGFPQEALPLYSSIGITPYGYSAERVDRLLTNLTVEYRPEHAEGAQLGAGLRVYNLFDDRSLLNLFSEFSGTRFVTGRRFLFNLNAHF